MTTREAMEIASKEGFKALYFKGRADAIDEYTKLMKRSFECGFNERVDRIAEQLKEQNNVNN